MSLPVVPDRPPFQYNSFHGYLSDGDTVRIGQIDLGMRIKLDDVEIRLVGVDTPELNWLRSRKAAFVASDLAAKWLDKAPCAILTHGLPDLYGRILGDFKSQETKERLTQHLLDLGVAMPSGENGERHDWTDAELAAVEAKFPDSIGLGDALDWHLQSLRDHLAARVIRKGYYA